MPTVIIFTDREGRIIASAFRDAEPLGSGAPMVFRSSPTLGHVQWELDCDFAELGVSAADISKPGISVQDLHERLRIAIASGRARRLGSHLEDQPTTEPVNPSAAGISSPHLHTGRSDTIECLRRNQVGLSIIEAQEMFLRAMAEDEQAKQLKCDINVYTRGFLESSVRPEDAVRATFLASDALRNRLNKLAVHQNSINRILHAFDLVSGTLLMQFVPQAAPKFGFAFAKSTSCGSTHRRSLKKSSKKRGVR
jgi:hypothetical protein